MLYIEQAKYLSSPHSYNTWHVREPLPTITARVVTFTADGDELELILAALQPKDSFKDRDKNEL